MDELPELSEHWQRLALRARELRDADNARPGRFQLPGPETDEAERQLCNAIAELYGPVVADWALTHWIIIRPTTIAESVEAERDGESARQRAAELAHQAKMREVSKSWVPRAGRERGSAQPRHDGGG